MCRIYWPVHRSVVFNILLPLTASLRFSFLYAGVVSRNTCGWYCAWDDYITMLLTGLCFSVQFYHTIRETNIGLFNTGMQKDIDFKQVNRDVRGRLGRRLQLVSNLTVTFVPEIRFQDEAECCRHLPAAEENKICGRSSKISHGRSMGSLTFRANPEQRLRTHLGSGESFCQLLINHPSPAIDIDFPVRERLTTPPPRRPAGRQRPLPGKCFAN